MVKQANGTTFSTPNLQGTAGKDYGPFKRTIKKDSYVLDISHQNKLFQFASYNTLFTLSALGESELENTKGLLTRAPHDVIIQGGGIGGDDNQMSYGQFTNPLNVENQKILNKNERMQKSLNKAQLEFKKSVEC